jgi:hypothetical protein
MAKLCGLISLVIFVCSAVVHFSTFIPSIAWTMHQVWPLHLATLAMFAIMLIALVARQARRARLPYKGLLASCSAARQRQKRFGSRLLGIVPRPLRLACAIALIYTFINFGIFAILMEGGSPSVENGQHYLQSHGRTIRKLTEPEYKRFLAYEVRGFSGHWMLASLVPTVYFLAVHPRLQGSNRSGGGED